MTCSFALLSGDEIKENRPVAWGGVSIDVGFNDGQSYYMGCHRSS